MVARIKQTDDEPPVYVVRQLPVLTAEQWVESCRLLRARESRIILHKRATVRG